MDSGEQTRIGRFFDRHPRLLRTLALLALVWGVGYLTWRVGWSGEGASPVLFAMLLVTELYGLYALAILTWFSWSRPAAVRPEATPGRAVDVYVCTYDEPTEVVMATLAGCRALTYPHTTYLLDDGRRPEMEELAKLAGARYLTRADNSHAKAGNLNAALPRTEGDLVLVLDADHVPMPDALDALVGYFDDERMAVVQTPHDFFNHDSAQHYAVGRHEQSLFYRVVCPGKDRHGAAYWCGSAALINRHALLAIGGVATETIAEDFHTTIRLLRDGWRSRYHDEVLVQGLAPHDLDGYLLQRDRWARGNLAVFTLPESPLRARELSARQRLSYLASLLAYLAPPMRLLLLVTLGLVLWTGALPMKISVARPGGAVAALAAAQPRRRRALARGYMRIPETAHYELLTMEIYTRALRCIVRPEPDGLQGDAEAGRRRRRPRRRAQAPPGPLLHRPARHRHAAAPARPGRRRAAAGHAGDRRGDRAAAGPVRAAAAAARRSTRSGGAASAASSTASRATPRPTASPPTATCRRAWSTPAPPASAWSPRRRWRSATARRCCSAGRRDRAVQRGQPPRSRSAAAARSAAASWSAPRSPTIDPESRLRLMEWCYVVCSHERLRGHRPRAAPARGRGDRRLARRLPRGRRRPGAMPATLPADVRTQ